MEECLVGLALLLREFSQFAQQRWIDAKGNELLGLAGHWSTNATGSTDAPGPCQIGVGRFRNITEINFTIRNMLCVLCETLVAR